MPPPAHTTAPQEVGEKRWPPQAVGRPAHSDQTHSTWLGPVDQVPASADGGDNQIPRGAKEGREEEEILKDWPIPTILS